ncbi:sulfotransferase family protein [Azomonas agilis]|uniref:Sulfotransferase family protein n=1 Tax=Azomonas agilis TaxID=116849 RepID=A0A562IZC2_9GAMM|nr:sulfotransferase family 2 domain-containing protein [Azomonas agilis]TWH76307.1 sulfotransferase family protein [Azomonas agilis]
MKLIRRLLWRGLSKQQKNYLLNNLPVVEQRATKKALFDKNQTLPEAFIEKNCIFIHIPKCAGKSLSLSLFNDTEMGQGHLPLNWYLQLFPEFSESAFKFSIVRDPLDRAYSAYCYLLKSTIPLDQPMKKMLEGFRSFDHFIDYWLYPDNIVRQIHFTPQYQFLTNTLGKINIDFIGRYETLDQDFKKICKTLNICVPLKYVNKSVKTGIYPISNSTREKIRTVYQRDYELFSY